MTPRPLWTNRQDAKFFDAIADGASIRIAAQRCEIGIQRARDRFNYVKGNMGEQGK